MARNVYAPGIKRDLILIFSAIIFLLSALESTYAASMTIQPDGTAGKDTWLNGQSRNKNYATNTNLSVKFETGKHNPRQDHRRRVRAGFGTGHGWRSSQRRNRWRRTGSVAHGCSCAPIRCRTNATCS